MKKPSTSPRHPRKNLVLAHGAISEMYRFEPFQQFVLSATPLLTPSSLALASLIAFDSVVTPQDVASAYEALQSVHLYRMHPTIRWEVPNDKVVPSRKGEASPTSKPVPQVHDERVISCFTVIAADQVQIWAPLIDSISELEEAMQREVSAKRERRLPRSFAQLMLAAHAYAGANLASAARAHVLGQVRMVALDPISALRDSSRLVMRAEDVDFEVEDAVAKNATLIARAVAQAIGSCGGESKLASHELVLVEDLVRACNAGNRLAPTAASYAVRRELSGVELRIGDHHVWSRLMLLIAYDMMQENELAMASMGRYFSGGAITVVRAVRELLLHKLDAKELCEKLLAAEEEAVESNRASVRILAKALVAQLVEQDLINPTRLPKGIGERYQGVVRAQVVWPHEVARAIEWIDLALARAPSDLILPMVRCAIGIGAGTGMRIGEVMRIRLKNLAVVQNAVQVMVAPTRMDPALKSRDSRRTCILSDAPSIKHILQFLSASHNIVLRGFDEAGAITDLDPEQLNRILNNRGELLFRDPHLPNALWHEATVRKWISILLKAATGHVKATFHDLRHTWVSLGNEADFALGSDSAAGSFDLRANALGHAVNDLMFTTYTHIFGIAARRSIDDRLVNSELLRTGSIASWVGRSDAALRKSLSRSGFCVESPQGQVHLLNAATTYASSFPLPTAHTLKELDLVAPISPLDSFKPAGTTIKVLLGSLRSLIEEGFPSQAGIAARAGITLLEWQATCRSFTYLNRYIKGVGKPPSSESEPEAWLVHTHWSESIDNAFAPKWRRIARYLETNALATEVQLAADYVARQIGVTRYLEVKASDPGFVALLKVFQGSGTSFASFALNYSLAIVKDPSPATSPPPASSADLPPAVRHALGKASKVFGFEIPTHARQLRAGRPDIYLTISSGNALEANKNVKQIGSANSMKGIAALFLATQLLAERSSEVKRAA